MPSPGYLQRLPRPRGSRVLRDQFVKKEDRDQAQKLLDLNSWNASCLLLKTSRLKKLGSYLSMDCGLLRLGANAGSDTSKKSLPIRFRFGVVRSQKLSFALAGGAGDR